MDEGCKLSGGACTTNLIFLFLNYIFFQLADITHSLQQPAGRAIGEGGVASGGLRNMIPTIARTCAAVGVDGIFMEVHDNPESSPVDGPTQWPLRNFRSLLEEIVEIAKVSKVKILIWCTSFASNKFTHLHNSGKVRIRHRSHTCWRGILMIRLSLQVHFAEDNYYLIYLLSIFPQIQLNVCPKIHFY